MKAQVQIISNENKEIINVDNIVNNKDFEYIDSYGANNHLLVFDNGIEIKRVCNSHNTLLHLMKNEDSYVIIDSIEGNVKISSKVLAFDINCDIISLVYLINSEQRKIIVKYLGD